MSEVMIDTLRVVYALHNKVGLTSSQLGDLCEILDKTPRQIQEILKAASDKWEGILGSLEPAAPEGRPPSASRGEIAQETPAPPRRGVPTYTREELLRATAAAVRLSKEQITKVRRKVIAFPSGGGPALDTCHLLAYLRDNADTAPPERLWPLIPILGDKRPGTIRRYPGRLFHWLFQEKAWPTLMNEKGLAQLKEKAVTPLQKERYHLLEVSCTGHYPGRGVLNRVWRMERSIERYGGPRAYVLGS